MISLDLAGRTALVSGSTQGIGAAVARRLAAAGARVGVNGRSAKSVEAAVAEFSAGEGAGSFFAAPGDVTDDDGLAAVRRAAPEVDILVNNLGIFGATPAMEIPDDEWRRFWEVNVLSAVRLIRHALPAMMERGGAGC